VLGVFATLPNALFDIGDTYTLIYYIWITMDNFCYILYNQYNNKTYVGFTNNPPRRIRQHNGELTGGARYTTMQLKASPAPSPWKFVLLVTSPLPTFDKKKALSLEWHIKHPAGIKKPTKGTLSRISALRMALEHAKFSDLTYTIFANSAFIHDIQHAITNNNNIDIRLLSSYTFRTESEHVSTSSSFVGTTSNAANAANAADATHAADAVS